MKKWTKIGCGILLIALFAGFLVISWGVRTRNRVIELEQSVKQRWAQVQNQYQRRYDLIPNLVEIVKGYAKHERETLQAVTEARAKVGGVIQLSPDELTPGNLAKFQEAQNALTGALQRLMVVVEQYPNLKANENFIRFQDELAGTENRIAVERMRYTEAVQEYNRYILQFPGMLIANIMGKRELPQFEALSQAQEAPKVQF